MADLSPYTPASVNDDEKLWALLMYLFTIMAPITLFALKDKLESPYIHYHARQATAWLCVAAVFIILSPCTLGLLALATGCGTIFFAYKAYTGEVFEIPFLTDQLISRGVFDPVKQLPPGA
mgnify:CR=1 FL=1